MQRLHCNKNIIAYVMLQNWASYLKSPLQLHDVRWPTLHYPTRPSINLIIRHVALYHFSSSDLTSPNITQSYATQLHLTFKPIFELPRRESRFSLTYDVVPDVHGMLAPSGGDRRGLKNVPNTYPNIYMNISMNMFCRFGTVFSNVCGPKNIQYLFRNLFRNIFR